MLIPASLFAQPDLQITRITRQWPAITLHYAIRCGAQLQLTHTPQQLTLTEDGVPVTSFTKYCPDTTLTGNISFAIVLDASGSTVGAFNRWIKSAAIAFIEKMKPTDEGAVLHFSTSATLVQAMTPDSAALKYAANLLTASGQSAAFDGVHAGLLYIGATATRSKRAVVVVADNDNSSTFSPDSLIRLSIAQNAPLILVGLGSSFNLTQFQTIAEQTGGKFYHALDSTSLLQVFRDAYEFIADEFETCQLVYTAQCPDGALRTVMLEANGVCGGIASDNGQYRALLDTSGRSQLVIGIPAVEALATMPFVVPLEVLSVSPGTLHPFDLDLVAYNNCMRLDSVTAPVGSPLAGTVLTGYPASGYLRIRSAVARQISGPGPLLNLHFTAVDRLDSASCPISIHQVLYSAGCYTTPGASGSVNVGVPPQPSVTPPGNIVLCPGQTVTLTAKAGYDRYEWSNSSTAQSIVVSTEGSYSVTVMDRAGRTATSAPVQVTFKPSPSPKLTVGPAITLCKGSAVNVRVNAVFPSYQWSTGLPSNSINVTQAGKYYVTVTDTLGCTWNSDTLTVTIADPQVNVTANGPLTFCDGGEVTLDAGSGFAGYRWSNNEQTQRIVVRNSGSYTVRVNDANGCLVTSDSIHVLVRNRPVASILPSGPPELCGTDTLELSGSPQFSSWHWSTGESSRTISVTQPGRYSLVVRDAFGCVSDTASILVTAVQRPALNLPDTVFICPSGNVDMDAGAGYASYQWSQGATTQTLRVNSAGKYFVRVSTSSGCVMYSDTVVVDIRAQLRPVITLSGPARICEGDSVRLDGGNYVSWDWSTGQRTRYITVRVSGTYSVAVEDAYGCTGSSDPVTITTVPAPAPTITASTPVRVCEGDSVVLVASPGFVDYRWSNGWSGQTVVITASGSYSVSVTNADGCRGTSAPIAVTIVPLPPKPVIVRTGDTLTASSASAYQWMKDGSAIPGVTGQSFIPSTSGSYAVRVFNADGCSADSDPIAVTGVAPAMRPRDLSLYPDPTSGRITISGEIDKSVGLEITATNLLGQVIARSADRNARGKFSRTIDISTAPRGVYLIHIRYGDRVLVRRVVKT